MPTFLKVKYLLFFIGAFIFTSFTQSPTALAASAHGVFNVVKGEVKVLSHKTGKQSRARVGNKVFPEDTIITSATGRAKITMVDKNVLNISPESEIKIERYEYDPAKGKKDVLLNVIYGKVRSKVNQKYDGDQAKFQVKTPSAVAGVRGTDFLTGFSRQFKKTEVITFEGRVQFGVPGAGGTIKNAVEVGIGQTASAVAGRVPTAPKRLPKNSLVQLDSESDAEKTPSPRVPANDKQDQQQKDETKEGPTNKKGAEGSDSPDEARGTAGVAGPGLEDGAESKENETQGPVASSERDGAEGAAPRRPRPSRSMVTNEEMIGNGPDIVFAPGTQEAERIPASFTDTSGTAKVGDCFDCAPPPPPPCLDCMSATLPPPSIIPGQIKDADLINNTKLKRIRVIVKQ